MNTIWEEKNCTEQETNNSGFSGRGLSGITQKTESDLTKNEWKDIGGLKRWTKNCPKCGVEQVYSHRSGFNRAKKADVMCTKCSKCLLGYKEKLSLLHKGKPNIYSRKRPYESIYNTMVRNATKRNISVELTYEEFVEFTNINTCTYCSNEIKWQPHESKRTGRNVASNLDRKNNLLGYEKSNCCVCCQMCNSIKNKFFSHQEMLRIGNLVKNILTERTQ
jgi:hypothetical protein